MAVKIDSMYEKAGGADYKHTCESCTYLMAVGRSNRNIYKCLMYGDDGTADSDWNKKYMACKLYKPKPLKPSETKNGNEIEGQTSIFDFMK